MTVLGLCLATVIRHGKSKLLHQLKRARDYLEKQRIIEARPTLGVIAMTLPLLVGYIAFMTTLQALSMAPNEMRLVITLLMYPMIELFRVNPLLPLIFLVALSGTLGYLVKY